MNPNETQFTGRHMLAIMLAFFGVIIAVNVTMATFASTSWTGFVVRNTYVASQEFNEKAERGRAQAALGWTGMLSIQGPAVRYGIIDGAGAPVALELATVTFRRPTSDAEDRSVPLAASDAGWGASMDPLHDGAWIVEIDAVALAGQPYRDVRRITLRGGAFK
jgi:nitrogen fixation protein FixH